jgi:hypothetical protein
MSLFCDVLSTRGCVILLLLLLLLLLLPGFMRRLRRARVAFTRTSRTVKGRSLGFWMLTTPERRLVELLTERVTCSSKTAAAAGK